MKKLAFLILIVLFILLLGFFWLRDQNLQIFNPKGIVALQEFTLLRFALVLSLLVVIPVFALTFYIAWKFRAGNQISLETQPQKSSVKLMLVWWAVPSLIISILAVTTWQATHFLDPYKTLSADKKPLVVQVVALRWKWLFIYPEQEIATVNFVEFPYKNPIEFNLTADAPMNSFWIPQLGGQMYAMAGMGTKLNLMATSTGEFAGQAAEINGQGFAGMKFTAKVTSENEFENWVKQAKNSLNFLDKNSYERLASPSEENPASYYVLTDKNLYNEVIMKFLSPDGKTMNMPGMQN